MGCVVLSVAFFNHVTSYLDHDTDLPIEGFNSPFWHWAYVSWDVIHCGYYRVVQHILKRRFPINERTVMYTGGDSHHCNILRGLGHLIRLTIQPYSSELHWSRHRAANRRVWTFLICFPWGHMMSLVYVGRAFYLAFTFMMKCYKKVQIGRTEDGMSGDKLPIREHRTQTARHMLHDQVWCKWGFNVARQV